MNTVSERRMNSDFEQDRLRRLERKVDTLTWVLGFQTILLLLTSLSFLLKVLGYLLLLLIVAAAVWFVFRRFLPQWRRIATQLRGVWDRRRAKFSEPRSS